jgi:hypothetical protein
MAKQKSAFLSSFGVSLNIFKAITDAVLAEGGSDDDLRSLLSDPEKCRRIALEIVGRKPALPVGGGPYRGTSVGESRDRITVPNLSAAELVTQAKNKLKLTYLDETGYAGYDFVTDEGGKTYEVLVWKPGRYVETKEVRKHFEELGAGGNTAAFVTWVTEHNPEGYYVSIPSDDSRLFRGPESGDLDAPRFCRGGSGRSLSLDVVHDGWDGHWSFVAFREVTGA